MAILNERLHERIVSKKLRVDSHRPLHPDLVSRLRQDVLVEYTHSSNAIEGNTLTLGETGAAIRGATVKGKSLREHLEARNHPAAIQYMESLAKSRTPITEEDVKHLHRILVDRILESPGDYRTGMVAVPGANFTPVRSSEIPVRLGDLLIMLERNPMEYVPVELASRFTHKFLVIHPFHDGNGRTSRLLLNLILMRSGYPILTNISYRERRRYIDALGEADLGNYSKLVNFIAMSVEESLTRYLVSIEELEVYTMKQAAENSPYSSGYLGLRARDGSLGAFKDGRNWKVTKGDLETYVINNRGNHKTS